MEEAARYAWDEGWRSQVAWKAPSLFCNDWACLKIAEALNERSGRAVLQTAYGAPACAWAGGRPALVQSPPAPDELRPHFEAYRRRGMQVSLTLSRRHVGAELLGDAYGNILLDLLDECGGSAIVWDDRLARHIRSTHPGIWLVASIGRSNVEWADGFPGCADEADFYQRTLELYDEVVVRSEVAYDEALLAQLEPLADRCQVLVNQSCPPDCRLYGRHAALGEQALQRGECMPHCMNPQGGQADMMYAEALMEMLVDRGFTHFKIRGRDLPPHQFARVLLGIVAADGDPAHLLERDVVVGLRMLSLPAADPLMRTCLP